ncbi:MAG: bifunctional UDP-N-acetylglucosamine diphosphorylase/glucosamine-1-phosphate N-acetyltransferase GlmU [Alphaproteobacteria bacterium]
MKASSAVPTAAVILAAGKGTRMGSELPKVMHRLAGFPLVGHVLYQAAQAGIDKLVVVIAPGMHQVSRYVCEMPGITSEVTVAVQEEQLGTAHAVLAAKDALAGFEGNLLVLYGDTPLVTTETLTRLQEVLLDDARCAVAVLGFRMEAPNDYGRLILGGDGALERIVEARDASAVQKKVTLCNSGVFAIRGNLAWELLGQIGNDNAKGEYYLTDIVELANSAGYRANVIETESAEVLGVNSRGELAAAEAAFQQRARRAHMDSGVTLLDPASVYFSADTVVGPDSLIEPNVFFGPGVAIGAGTHIKAFSHIEGSVIGDGAVVGPFARLRPGTNLGEKVKIGNFVEVKKSEIEAGAKINHLSYIGDAEIGENSNIGAGTITCNYDGFHKYRTTIGRDVFVGSNTSLVAPLTIGEGAMIAAGSVITEDIAPDALALARTRQEQKQDWAVGFRERKVAEKKAAKKKKSGTD